MKKLFGSREKTTQPPQMVATGRYLEVPAKRVPEILSLHDDYATAPPNGNRAACYFLWSEIHKTLPATKEGFWAINFVSAVRVQLVELREGGA